MLYVDKYRPTSLSECDYHVTLGERLEKLSKSEEFPHCLFYGQSGAGKKTRILGLLRALYGAGVEKVKTDQRSFQTAKKAVEITTVSSPFHIEMNPSEVGHHDKVVVQEVIKEIAQSQPLEISADSRGFKVVVLNEVDKLTLEAQAGLRRTMEKYMRNCRMILCCTSVTKVIPALRSRCLCIRIAAPTPPEICSVLQSVANKEKFNLSNKFAAVIAKKANRNLRRALLMLETAKMEQYPFVNGQKIHTPEWEEFVQSLALQIIEEQSPKRLLFVRNKVYELLVHCIPPELIIKRLTLALIENTDNTIKFELTQWASFYEHRVQQGSKAIYHIEAFVAKFMAVYKDYLIKRNLLGS